MQFFREASDVQFDETGNRKRKYRYGDEDELELEQQERKRRQMLNKEFRLFSEKIAEAATVREISYTTGSTVRHAMVDGRGSCWKFTEQNGLVAAERQVLRRISCV